MEGSDPKQPFGPGSPGYGPGGEPQDDEDTAGPQSPAPSGYPPPPPAPGPETVGAPPTAPSYGGPVPPGGWDQPAVPAQSAVPQGALASWGSRLGAYLIDGLVLSVPAVISFLVIVAGAVGLSDADEDVAVGAAILATIGWFIVIALIVLLYAPLLMARQGARNGQTWGKQALGIRVVRDNGRPFDFVNAALREAVLKILAVFIASSIIPFIPWFLNFFWPLWDDQNRALHDMAASTHVVRT